MPHSSRRSFKIQGAVQGVGFRPFVHRLARELELAGWVMNTGAGVSCEVEGVAVEMFARRLKSEAPKLTRIETIESADVPVQHAIGFRILDSSDETAPAAGIQPDLATCAECQREIFAPDNRRYRYPFTNCTRCGPRFSIIERIPYDRGNTTMKDFTMCAACETEYRDPEDRRFHAQPNACPECGPQLWLTDRHGHRLAERDQALIASAQALREGRILAVKGIGGFHLLADATNAAAVRLLRKRKRRCAKPFATLFPAMEDIERVCECGRIERDLLLSSAAPIVLLRRRATCALPDEIVPQNARLGVMLPYSPLHHLLLQEVGRPVVATSGNLAEEPICCENADALRDLATVADLFLLHDRPIRRPVDDSVVQVVAGREMVLRRSRGYAPLPVSIPDGDHRNVLAVGADLKNTIAWLRAGKIWLSQHLGDLGTVRSLDAHARAKTDLIGIYPGEADGVAHDAHPDYHSTRHAEGPGRVSTQHHHAHVVACMAEHDLHDECLGVAWDGTGYGPDGTIWGGEFLLASRGHFRRFQHLLPFPLPGGEAGIRDPRRTLAGLRFAAGLPRTDLLPRREADVVARMLERNVNCPCTTSMGRLFDAVAALLGLADENRFEGEAAMRLESAIAKDAARSGYPVVISETVDWRPLLSAITTDRQDGVPAGIIAARFHQWLTDVILTVARAAQRETVVLSGGCFQNCYLLEAAVDRLQRAGFNAFWPRNVPPNDGGIALGQAVIATSTDPKR